MGRIMPRKKKKDLAHEASEPVALADALPEVPAVKAIIEAHHKKATQDIRSEQEPVSEAPQPKDREIVTGRPIGPRKRDVNEPGTLYTGPNITLSMDADGYQIEAKKPLSTEQQDKIVAAGFDEVSDGLWQATKQAVRATGKDINVLAVMLDGKAERTGRGR